MLPQLKNSNILKYMDGESIDSFTVFLSWENKTVQLNLVFGLIEQ